jgi:hypothetical protein
MSCLTEGNRLGRRAPHLTDDPAQRDQLQRRAARHPAAKSNSSGNSGCKIVVGSFRRSYSGPVSCAPGFMIHPSSAAVARPVRQRHRSIASCRANATALFFLSEAGRPHDAPHATLGAILAIVVGVTIVVVPP